MKTIPATIFLVLIIPFIVSSQETADPETLKNEGNLLYRDGNIDEAILKWQEAIFADSTYSFAYNNIGVALYDKKDYQGSADYLERAVALDSTYAKAFNSLGNAYLALEEYEAAQAAYESALKYESYDPEIYTNLGNIHLATGNYDLAAAAYEEALDIDGDYAPALNNRGLILWRRGDLDKAVDSFRKAIKSDSQFLDAYVNLGMLYVEREDPDGKFRQTSLDYLNKAEAMDPENPDILYNLCIYYLKTNDAPKSRQYTAKYMKNFPDDPVAHYLLGYSYSISRMYQQALDNFTQAFTLDPNFSQARIAIDEVSQVMGK